MTLAVDYKAIWDYDAQPKEWVTHCNLCGRPNQPRLDQPRAIDRYGYAVSWVLCPCDLHYLAHRMTREAYARFYETAYRPLVSAFHGRDVMETIEEEQDEYAERLLDILPNIGDPTEQRQPRVLDIGGSTGVVGEALAEILGAEVTVMDPAPAEVSKAANRGLFVLSGTLESYFDVGTLGRFDLITLCQTADHLLDLMGSLKKIKGLLSEGGLFWSDIVDFDVTREVKIDHPFNLTESTYRKFLLKAGFTLLQVNWAPDGKHIGFLCR